MIIGTNRNANSQVEKIVGELIEKEDDKNGSDGVVNVQKTTEQIEQTKQTAEMKYNEAIVDEIGKMDDKDSNSTADEKNADIGSAHQQRHRRSAKLIE